MNVDKICDDLRRSKRARHLVGSCWQVWGMYIYLDLTPCGCFEWAGSSPQYVRDGAHLRPETLRRWLLAGTPEEAIEIWENESRCETTGHQKRRMGNALRVNEQQGRL